MNYEHVVAKQSPRRCMTQLRRIHCNPVHILHVYMFSYAKSLPKAGKVAQQNIITQNVYFAGQDPRVPEEVT